MATKKQEGSIEAAMFALIPDDRKPALAQAYWDSLSEAQKKRIVGEEIHKAVAKAVKEVLTPAKVKEQIEDIVAKAIEAEVQASVKNGVRNEWGGHDPRTSVQALVRDSLSGIMKARVEEAVKDQMKSAKVKVTFKE